MVATANRKPLQAVAQAVAEGISREGLMHRLNAFPIEVPPLRERLKDVPLLAVYFLQAMGQQEDHTKRFSAEAMHRLDTYRWTGHVRALRNAVQGPM